MGKHFGYSYIVAKPGRLGAHLRPLKPVLHGMFLCQDDEVTQGLKDLEASGWTDAAVHGSKLAAEADLMTRRGMPPC